MRKALRLVVLISALGAAPASAAPVYLTCDFPNDGGSFIVNVTADEQAGTVSLFMPSTNNRQQLTGTFTADRLIFSDRYMRYTINRVDLSIVRETPMIRSVESGQCKVQQPPKRAF